MRLNKAAVIALVMFSFNAIADAPYINNNTASSDERVSDGEITCETNKAQATINSGVFSDSNSYHYYQGEDKGAYIGVSIPIGGEGSVDCSKLYDQVLHKNQLKIKQLEQQIALLQRRQLTASKEKQ